MLSDRQIVEWVRRSNPVADLADLPDPRHTATALLDLQRTREPAMTDTTTRTRLDEADVPRWRGPAIAAAAMVALLVGIGVVALAPWGSVGEVASPLVCPAGSTPDVTGQASQTRPDWSPSVNQGAAFDEARGRIVYVDGDGETWTFDVCTNTWERSRARVPGFGEYQAGDLVYDVDSDRTIGIDPDGGVNVFDATSDRWTKDPGPSLGIIRGAVYDPVTGLVVVAHLADGGDGVLDTLNIYGYDVDTGEGRELGTVVDVWNGSWMFLLGYSSESDELVFHGGYAPAAGDPLDTHYSGASPTTVLHSLRTGISTVLPGGPNLFSPWGAWYPYATGVDGAVVTDGEQGAGNDGTHTLCRFDGEGRQWDGCAVGVAAGPGRVPSEAAMTYDPINDRLVIIYPLGGVWAIDLDTGEWIELVG